MSPPLIPRLMVSSSRIRTAQINASPKPTILLLSIRCSLQNKRNGSDRTARKPRPIGKTHQQPRKDGDRTPKQAKCLESAVVTQKISSFTAQNKKMIAALTTSDIEIPDSDPSPGKEDDGDCKMAANKKNSNLTKTNKRRK